MLSSAAQAKKGCCPGGIHHVKGIIGQNYLWNIRANKTKPEPNQAFSANFHLALGSRKGRKQLNDTIRKQTAQSTAWDIRQESRLHFPVQSVAMDKGWDVATPDWETQGRHGWFEDLV